MADKKIKKNHIAECINFIVNNNMQKGKLLLISGLNVNYKDGITYFDFLDAAKIINIKDTDSKDCMTGQLKQKNNPSNCAGRDKK